MAASKAGLCLDEAAQLDVQLPEAEFGENMVSGGFQVWKGLPWTCVTIHLSL
ncbi:MAG: hypothetical protein LUQ22_07720 [Methanotrichaceae archaeon]|nr:hypothetical protein [Methanotrichaceae archaeon]